MRIHRFLSRLLASGLLSVATSAFAAPGDPGLYLARLKTGVTLEYVAQGPADGPPIVLLHGAGDSWHSYDRVLPLLPARFRVYALTLRGHGRSDHPAQGYERQDFAADVLAFFELLGIRHATLVGHSLGSFVAQDVARAAGDRVDRLVLVGASAGPPRDPAIREAIAHDFGAVADPVPYAFARDFQIGTVYGPVPPSFLETMVGEAGRLEAAAWHAIGRTLTAPDAYHDPSGIRVPALIVWGARDSIFGREEQQDLLKKVADARLVVYPETGHDVHWEQPRRFTRDLLEFISTKTP